MPSPPLVKSSLTSFHMAAPVDSGKGGLSNSNMESSLEDPFQDSSGLHQIDEVGETATGTPPAGRSSQQKVAASLGGGGGGGRGGASTGTPTPAGATGGGGGGGVKGEKFHAPLSSTPKTTEGVEYMEESQGEIQRHPIPS